MRERRGFALMAAMWLVVLIGAGAWRLSMQARARRLATANTIELIEARTAAQAGLATAHSALADSASATDGRSRLDQRRFDDPWWSFASDRLDSLSMATERATVSYYDPSTRLDLNLATAEELERFLIAAGATPQAARAAADRIVDWRDADDTPHPHGAERDAYLRAGAPRLPSNVPFGSISELLSIDGIDTALLTRIAPRLTLWGRGQVNVNLAPREVLSSLPGFTDETVAAVMRLRAAHHDIRALGDIERALSRTAAAELAAHADILDPRLVFETRELVVQSIGWVDGSPLRARVEMLVERSGESVIVQARRHWDE